MSTVTAQSFQSVVMSALERMAFVIAEAGEATPGEVVAQAFGHASVDITEGETRTALTVTATAGMLREIAAGMMGAEPDEIDVDEHGGATLGELANVLGGELVMQLGGDTIPMQLGLPREVTETEVGAVLDRAADGAGFACVLASDAGSLLVASRRG